MIAAVARVFRASFGDIADPRSQTIQIKYNDGPPNSIEAAVVPILGWNGYVIPFTLEGLWALPDELYFDAYVGENRVASGYTKVMGKVAEGLEKCDN